MKKIFKTISVCIGLPVLNLFMISIVQMIFLIFANNIKEIGNYTYSLVLIADFITLALVVLIFLPVKEKFMDRITIKKLALSKWINIIILGIGVSIVLLFLTGILTQIIPSYKTVENQLSNLSASFIYLIIAIIVIPIYEELFYRGIIFGYLRKNCNIIFAIIVQALIFGLMHLNIVQAIYTFILGIVLSLVYMYSESIIGNILLHIIFNLLGVLIVPKLVAINPNISFILLIIGIISLIFSIIKILEKYEDNLYK